MWKTILNILGIKNELNYKVVETTTIKIGKQELRWNRHREKNGNRSSYKKQFQTSHS